MLVVFAGNRIDAPDRLSPRFPGRHADWVGTRLLRLLAELRPSAVVGGAAAGADLLVLEAAASLRIPAHVVLPFPVEVFRDASVADQGEGWAARFDRLVAAVPSARLHVGDADPGAQGVYAAANAALLDVAQSLSDGQTLLALAIRPKSIPAGSVTDDFAARARARGIDICEIDPRLGQAQMRSAFVVMPYGVKTDAQGRSVDCEATFSRVVVPALEGADLDWTRADREADAGIIYVGMLHRLATADVVIVDTATDNPNAFYALGARHVLRPRQTILLGPEDSRLPFNVAMLRRVSYRLTGSAVSEADALAAVRRLRPLLELPSATGPDSPLYRLFDVEPPRIGPAGSETAQALQLHRRLDEAADADGLLAVAAQIDVADVSASQRTELVLRVGLRLRERGAYEEAVRRLGSLPVEEADVLHRWWSQQLALAERRWGEELAEKAQSPDALWESAQRRLDAALRRHGDDPETCGMAAGLAKRRALRALRADATAIGRVRAAALLGRALELYRRGFDRQPGDFYTGVNVVTVGRVLAELRDASPDGDLVDVATVTAFHLRRARTDDVWTALTTAELVLNKHLAASRDVSSEAVLAAYAGALALPHPVDVVRAVRDQLDLVRLAGADVDGAVSAVLVLPELRVPAPVG